jgi:hypothetical protein
MTCAACGYNGSSEKDFGSELFLSVQVYLDINDRDRLSNIDGRAVRIFVCPKCMTLKLRTPEDEEDDKRFDERSEP